MEKTVTKPLADSSVRPLFKRRVSNLLTEAHHRGGAKAFTYKGEGVSGQVALIRTNPSSAAGATLRSRAGKLDSLTTLKDMGGGDFVVIKPDRGTHPHNLRLVLEAEVQSRGQ